METNKAPLAEAGHDTALGVNDTIHLHGSGSDSDGYIVKYEWKCGNDVWKTTSTGDTNIIAPSITQIYACFLRVTDDDGLFGVDDIIIAVKAPPQTVLPAAEAGKDTIVIVGSQLRLHGTGTDVDGFITKYEWKLDSSDWVVSATGDTMITVPLTAQIYKCFLRVTDNDGLVDTDEIIITIKALPQKVPPEAEAGKDAIVIVGGQLRLHGTGTDIDGFITKYEWKLDSSDWVVSATSDTMITVPLTEQIYKCFFRVTDNDGLVDTDDILITVLNTPSDEMFDIDGNKYAIITLGNQVWFAENLRVTRYNDGMDIPIIAEGWGNLDSGACSYYDNNNSNKSIYGMLYNGYAIETGKLAPEGWHVPTDADWDTLQSYLIANGYNWDGTTTDNKIGKAMAAQTGWFADGSDGSIGYNMSLNNRSGFTALPGGWRHFSGRYNSIGNFCAWWSATRTDQDHLYYRSLISKYSLLIKGDNSKPCGKYVRLVKD